MDEEFVEAYKVCSNFKNHFYRKFSEFTLQNRMLYKGNQLCVPRGSIRENPFQEKNNGSLSEYFGVRITLELVQRF